MHYILIIAIIAVIVIIQFRSFLSTKRKLTDFEDVFTEDSEEYHLQTENLNLIEEIKQGGYLEHAAMLITLGINIDDFSDWEIDGESIHHNYHKDKVIDLLINNAKQNSNKIKTSHSNSILSTIFKAINNYLANNKGKDFHLMKDIVDRNCDAKEEEIHTQIPVPLYLGLVGTMAGILVGILYLWLSGGIGDLLSAGGSSGADGVEALLGGVALAMISSICGIILTTLGSHKVKTAKAKVERNKNTFLSWLQAELLPTMNDSIAHTLETMTANLTDFNKTFTDNTTNLGTALAKVNESYRLQTELITVVNQIRKGDVTQANVALLNKLIECSSQIGKIAEYLENSNNYITNVRALNEKLDASEQRSKAIEEMATFFKNEISQVEQRKEAINKAVGSIDSILEERLRKLAEHAAENTEKFYKALGKQQDALQKKLEETDVIVSELKNLSAIKDSISKFEKAMSAQNNKLDTLANAIQALAKAKAEGTSSSNFNMNMKPKTPVWKKALIWGLSAIGGLILTILLIANWQSVFEFIKEFRF